MTRIDKSMCRDKRIYKKNQEEIIVKISERRAKPKPKNVIKYSVNYQSLMAGDGRIGKGYTISNIISYYKKIVLTNYTGYIY